MSRPRGDATTLGVVLRHAVERLGGAHEDARTDAEILLAHVTGRSRHHATAWPEHPVDHEARSRFEALIGRRAAGEPVAHLTGTRGFWTFDLEVTPQTLIPRPETERLVEVALACDPPGAAVRVLDLGTGTGAVAIALALERPGWVLFASDASAATLAVAARNVERIAPGRVTLCEGDWLDVVRDGERLSLIVSNPPYVAEDDPHLGRGDLRFEPRSALAAGVDGLDAIRAIVAAAPMYLVPGGWLVLEHGYEQGPAVAALLAGSGFVAVATHADLAGHDRVAAGRWPG